MRALRTSKELRIFFLLQQAAHRLKKEADRTLTGTAGLTAAQTAVLVIVSAARSTSQKDIATQLRLNESAMTAMIGRLLKAGMISRSHHPTDARTRLISLSPVGKRALERARRPFSVLNAKLDAALGGSRTAALAKDLNAIIGAFQPHE